ncbi:MAG: hypothetical protein ABIK89_23870 [Planctomycetota bacterium]
MTTETDSTSDARPLSRAASSARLIVCERRGDWAVALRRELEAAGPRVHETRSVAECWEMLAGWPASFVVAELTRLSAKALLERMAWLERDFPWARVAVVAERSFAWSEWGVREAGAVHFTVSPRQLGPLASLAVRHLAAVPRPRLGLTERIWADLPWKRND